ncbi:hypothetical protein H9L39_07100 [Fusarium oxysporum f. sp. albedinis]|nr:hypothetical protein H9L39_07100 [Fusarium oxysporum f. sp. albedinis]
MEPAVPPTAGIRDQLPTTDIFIQSPRRTLSSKDNHKLPELHHGKVERPTPVKLHQQREALEQDSRLPRFWTATETLLTCWASTLGSPVSSADKSRSISKPNRSYIPTYTYR